jgi:hypothetical protein
MMLAQTKFQKCNLPKNSPTKSNIEANALAPSDRMPREWPLHNVWVCGRACPIASFQSELRLWLL